MKKEDYMIKTIIEKNWFLNKKELIIQRETIPLNKISFVPLADAEQEFRLGKKLIIDDRLSQKKIIFILDKLAKGVPLSDEERQHVLTAQEFYRAHEAAFLKRAEETANTAREFEFLAKALAPVKNQPILDIGCGLGRLTAPLLKAGYNMYGIDVAPNLIARARRDSGKLKNRFFIADLFHLPFKPGYFGGIIMMWHVVSEVSHNLNEAFAEVNAALMPGGLLIFDVPDTSSDQTRVKYSGRPGGEDYAVFLAKIPPIKQLASALEINGFQILEIRQFLWGIHKFVIVCRKK